MAITKENWEEKLGEVQDELNQLAYRLTNTGRVISEIARRANDAGYAEGRVDESIKEEIND